MSSRPKFRTVRGRRIYDREPQWWAPAGDDTFSGGWAVSRQRPEQHAYLLTFNGQWVGVLLRFTDGWRWQTTWDPRTGGQQTRVSAATFPTWQTAASKLIRTSVGRLVCRDLAPPAADAWKKWANGVRGAPWEPKPWEPEQAAREVSS